MCTASTTRSPATARHRTTATWNRAEPAPTPGAPTPPAAARTAPGAAGSAGYWHYHDHVVGTEHGTGGIRKGLYGPVIVRRAGDVLPDATHTIVFNDMTINNRPAHSGPDFEATVGDRVEFVMITHGEYYHTFHLHGHRWADNRTGTLTGPEDPSQVIDNKIVGPADSFGFQVIAGEGVGSRRVDVPLPCAEPLRHGHGGPVPGEEAGRHDPRVRAAPPPRTLRSAGPAHPPGAPRARHGGGTRTPRPPGGSALASPPARLS